MRTRPPRPSSTSRKKPRCASCGDDSRSEGRAYAPTGQPSGVRMRTTSALSRARHHASSAAAAAAMSAARAAAVAMCGSARSPASGEAARRVPLVGCEPDQLHPTVATLDHPEEAVAVAFAVERDAVVVEAAEARAVQRQLRLLDRDVDALTPTGPEPVVAGGEHRDGRVPPGVVLRDVAPDLHRRPLREELPARAARQDRSLAAGMERDEMVGAVARRTAR